MTLDLLLRNARIIDGTGAPWFRGAIGVDGDTIERVVRGDAASETAVTEVDVDGAAVCPGFIDTHSHSDLQVLAGQPLEPKLRQGVTTEILGQDGLSVAPVFEDAAEWETRMRPLAGRSDAEWTWGGVADYLDAIEDAGTASNVATLVGHGTVRYAVLGMSERAPDETELEEMARLVREGLEDGAVGFSTGLVYAPQLHAATGEVRRLARELRPYGRPFVAHVRGEGRRIWDAMDEFVDVGADEGVPLHVSHFKLAGPAQHGKADRLLALLAVARDRGVDITADQYPYTAGNTMLTSVLPPWAQTESTEGTLETLREEGTRERMKREIAAGTTDWENVAIRVGWENVVIATVDSEGTRWMQGTSVAEIADREGKHPVDAVCDLLIEAELDVSMFIHHIDPTDMETILRHEWVAVATDGLFGDNPHPRLYGTYPRVLGRYVRERNHLELEAAVRKMTSLPARAMGLDRKGVVRPGMDADLVVFDPETVAGPATFESPTRPPRGIPHVVVNGEFVVRDSAVTGATPGTVLRA